MSHVSPVAAAASASAAGPAGFLRRIALAASLAEFAVSLLLLRGSEPCDATDAEAELGSSEYAKEVLGAVWGFPPSLELEKEAAVQKCIVELIGLELVESAHDCSEGGLAVAFAESGFPNQVGVRVELTSEELPAECTIFGEDASRIVISCDPNYVGRIQEVGLKYGVAVDPVGQTVPEKFEVLVNGKLVVSAAVTELKDVWEHALERALHVEAAEELVSSGTERS